MDRTSSPTGASAFSDPSVTARLIDLSQAFIFHALDGETDACTELFAADGLWFGPSAERGDCTIEGFRAFCDGINRERLRVVLSRLSFDVFPAGGGCAVVARCLIYLGLGGGAPTVIGRPMRVVFFWRLTEQATVRVACLSVGFLLDELELATDTAPDDLAAGPWSERFEVRDTAGAVRFLSEDDIVYLEAQGRRTTVHTMDGQFIAQESIGDFQERLSHRFVRLHRTYLVNGWYVKSISAAGAQMADGAVLPVPARRLVSLRGEINAIKKPMRLSPADLESALRASMTEDA